MQLESRTKISHRSVTPFGNYLGIFEKAIIPVELICEQGHGRSHYKLTRTITLPLADSNGNEFC